MSQTLLTVRSKETWTKCTPTTFLRQRELALIARITLFALWNFVTVFGPIPYLGLELIRTKHTCHQKPNPSSDTVPLRWTSCKKFGEKIRKRRESTVHKCSCTVPRSTSANGRRYCCWQSKVGGSQRVNVVKTLAGKFFCEAVSICSNSR